VSEARSVGRFRQQARQLRLRAMGPQGQSPFVLYQQMRNLANAGRDVVVGATPLAGTMALNAEANDSARWEFVESRLPAQPAG
jgi:hypothetical protein